MHNKDEGSARDLPKLQYSIEKEGKKEFLPIFNIINYRPIQKMCYKHIFSCTLTLNNRYFCTIQSHCPAVLFLLH